MSAAVQHRGAAPDDATETVVTFGIGEALFALPVAPVMEIHDTRDIAPLPKTPPHLLGLMDRRGFSVPVIDMRLMLGLPPREDSQDTRIIALQVRQEGQQQLAVGLRVDRVIEVAKLDATGSRPLAEAEFLRWHEGMVAGIGRRNGAFVTLIDVAGLFKADLESLKTSQEAAPA